MDISSLHWKQILVGLLLGIVVGYFVFGASSRFEVVSSGSTGFVNIRIDKRTGKSWVTEVKVQGNETVWRWKEISEAQ